MYRAGGAAERGRSLLQPAPDTALRGVQELEGVAERICRLVLNAQALADRMAAIPGGSAQARRARDERVDRLRAAVDLGRQGLHTAIHQHADRRRGERRAATRPPIPPP